jgi:hypothetical protein
MAATAIPPFLLDRQFKGRLVDRRGLQANCIQRLDALSVLHLSFHHRVNLAIRSRRNAGSIAPRGVCVSVCHCACRASAEYRSWYRSGGRHAGNDWPGLANCLQRTRELPHDEERWAGRGRRSGTNCGTRR